MKPKYMPKYYFELSRMSLTQTDGTAPILDIFSKGKLELQIGLNVPHIRHKPHFNKLLGESTALEKQETTKIFKILYHIFETDSSISTFTWNKLNKYKISFSDQKLERILLEESNSLKIGLVANLLKNPNEAVRAPLLLNYLRENPEDYPRVLSMIDSSQRKLFHHELKFYIKRVEMHAPEKLVRIGDNCLENYSTKEWASQNNKIGTPGLKKSFSNIRIMPTTLNQRASKQYSPDIKTFQFEEPIGRYLKRKKQINII